MRILLHSRRTITDIRRRIPPSAPPSLPPSSWLAGWLAIEPHPSQLFQPPFLLPECSIASAPKTNGVPFFSSSSFIPPILFLSPRRCCPRANGSSSLQHPHELGVLSAGWCPCDCVPQTHSSDSDDDEADGNAPAWSNVPSTSLAPAAGAAAAAATPAVGSALWSAAQRSAEEAKAKSRALAELESRRAEEMEREKAALLSAGEERKRAAEAEEQARIATEQRAIEEKRIKLEADREAARRARAARANQLSEANPSGIASGQADEMSEMERNL